MIGARRLISFTLVSLIVLAAVASYNVPVAEALCIPPYGATGLEANAQGDKLYVLWEYGTWGIEEQQADHYLHFVKSADSGKSFGETVTLYHSDPKCSLYPQMAADGNNVYVMWEDGYILFKASNDGGVTFGETITLGRGTLGSIGIPFSYNEGGRILADGDRAYAVWNNDGNLVFRKSEDGGKSFSPEVQLTQDAETFRPEISVSGSNVYVAWVDNVVCLSQIEPACDSEVVFVKSSDYGETFTAPATLDEITGDEAPLLLSLPRGVLLTSADTNVYMLWREADMNIYFTASNDNGRTFSDKMRLSDLEPDQYGRFMLFEASEDTVYVSWQTDDVSTTILKSTDGGEEFSQAELPIPEEFSSSFGRLVMEAGHAYFMWLVYSDDESRLSFASAQEDISDPATPVHLVVRDSSSEVHAPSDVTMAAAGDTVHMLWIDASGPQSDYRQQVEVRTSTNAGKSFGNTVHLASLTTVPEFGALAPIVMAAAIAVTLASIVLVRRRFK